MSTRWLWLVLSLGLLIRVLTFTGLIGSDDLGYNREAYLIAQDSFGGSSLAHLMLERTNYARLGLIMPVAFFIRLLGVGEIASILYPLVTSIASIALVFLIGKLLFDVETGLLAALLLAVFPLEVQFGTVLFPDGSEAFFAALAAYLLIVARRAKVGWRIPVFFFLSGMSFGMAYLTKELVVLLVPVLFVTLLCDAVQDRRIPYRYAWFALGVLLVIGPEMVYYLRNTGDALFRIHVKEQLFNADPIGGLQYLSDARQVLMERLTLGYVRMLLVQRASFGLFYSFALVAAAYCLWRREKTCFPLLVWWTMLLLAYNFASVSVSRYVPIIFSPHYAALLNVPTVLLVAFFLVRLLRHVGKAKYGKQNSFLALGASLLATGVAAVVAAGVHLVSGAFGFGGSIDWARLQFAFLFLSISLGAATIWIYASCRERRVSAYPYGLMLVGLLIVSSVYYAANPGPRGASLERELWQFLETQPAGSNIYVDEITLEILDYFSGYQSGGRLEDFEKVGLDDVKGAFVVVNFPRMQLRSRSYGTRFPHIVFAPPEEWKLIRVFGNGDNRVLVYYVLEPTGLPSVDWQTQWAVRLGVYNTVDYSRRERALACCAGLGPL